MDASLSDIPRQTPTVVVGDFGTHYYQYPKPDPMVFALARVTLKCPPNITGFYNWHKFTDRPIPLRHNYESDAAYVKRNWWRLRIKAKEFLDTHEPQLPEDKA